MVIECAGAPVQVAAAGELNAVALSWSAGTGASPTAYYVVVGDGRVLRVGAPASGVRVDGLRNGLAVEFTVYAATAGGVGPGVSVQGTPTSGMEGEVAGLVVKYADGAQPDGVVPGASAVSAVGLSDGGEVAADVRKVEFSEATSLATAQAVAEQLEASPEVEWAEPDQFVFTAGETVSSTDQEFAQQWNLWDANGIDAGHDGSATSTSSSFSGTGAGVRVAVVDTGVVPHPDLEGALVPGYDFVSDPASLAAPREPGGPSVAFDADEASGWDSDATDPGDWRSVAPSRSSTWHGTQMAGLIAARSGNGGIVGVAPSASVQPVRALSWRGGLLSDVAAAITWASGGTVASVPANPTPSQVVSLSFAVEAACPVSLQSAIDGAVARGAVVVAAAGNAGSDSAAFAPANCANVIGVGATDRSGKRASYSNWGPAVDLSAPGGSLASDGGVRTASNSGTSGAASPGYGFAEGTSVAAAQVSGAVARMLSSASSGASLTPSAVASALTGSAVKAFAGSSCDADASRTCGAGILSLAQVATGTSGGVDTYLSFDGDDVATAPGAIVPTGDEKLPFTVEAWVWDADQSPSGSREFVSQGPTDNCVAARAFYLGTTTANRTIRAGDSWVDTGVTLPANQWVHVALVASGDANANATLYLNGSPVKTKSGYVLPLASSQFRVGNQYGTCGGERWIGKIDDVRVWNTARTDAEVRADMETQGPVNAVGLRAFYDMNEGSGTSLTNRASGTTSAGSGANLTLAGTPRWAAYAATPAYPGIAVATNSASGSYGSPITVGDFSVTDATSVGWSSVVATVSATAGSLTTTASNAATVTGNGTSALTITGSQTDVASTLDAVRLSANAGTQATVTARVVPASRFTTGDRTYYFNPANGHYYARQTTSESWESASVRTLSSTFAGAGGYLLVVQDKAEDDFVKATVLPGLGASMWTAGVRCAASPRQVPCAAASVTNQLARSTGRHGAARRSRIRLQSAQRLEAWASGARGRRGSRTEPQTRPASRTSRTCRTGRRSAGTTTSTVMRSARCRSSVPTRHSRHRQRA